MLKRSAVNILRLKEKDKEQLTYTKKTMYFTVYDREQQNTFTVWSKVKKSCLLLSANLKAPLS